MPEPEQTSKPILECKLKYLLRPGTEQAPHEAQVALTSETLTVMPNFGTPLLYSLRDIISIEAGDHRLCLNLTGGEELELMHLGYTFDDFVRILSRTRNELNIQDMLMQESVRTQGITAAFSLTYDHESQPWKGHCEPRLYETALVILPEFGDPIRIPYSNITDLEAKNYTLSLSTELGQRLALSHMGEKFDYFTSQLSQIMNDLSLKAQQFLKDLLPQALPQQIREAAHLMREGKAARRGDLDAICPQLWTSLELRLEAMGLKHEYDFLRTQALPQKISIGFKRGLMGDLTGEYIWFLIPIWESNVMAMEAASGTGGGRATYFFRLSSRADFSLTQNDNQIDALVDEMIGRINQGMLAINFRREPIYLPEQRLADPRYDKYRYAIALLPALRELRQLFIGRVFHRSADQWEQDVSNLLAFNISAGDDNQKWSKADETNEDEDFAE